MLSEKGDVIKKQTRPGARPLDRENPKWRTDASLLIGVVVWTSENDTKTTTVDANVFENGGKQLRFRLKNGLVWTGPENASNVSVHTTPEEYHQSV